MNTQNDSKGDRNMRKYGIAMLAGAAAAALGATDARAATIVLGPGDDIQAAVDAAVSGDTIKLLDGRYNQSVVIAGKKLRIQGQSKTGVIIDSTGTVGPAFHFDGALAGSSVKNLTVVFNGGNAVSAVGSEVVATENLVVRGTRGMPVYNDTPGGSIKGLIARGNGDKVRASGSGNTVSGNKLYRSAAGLEVVYPLVLKSNVIEDCDHGIAAFYGTFTSDRNGARRISGNGIYLEGSSLTSYKEKARSVRSNGIILSATGGSGNLVDGPNVKNCAGTGVLTYGSDVDVKFGKMDNCNLAIGCSASYSVVHGNVVKNGGRGISGPVPGTEISYNTLTNLLRSAIECQGGGLNVHDNVVTAAGESSSGAITFHYSTGTFRSNVIGDADAGAAVLLYNSSMTIGGLYAGYPAGNTIADVSGAGVLIDGSHAWYYSSITENSISRCGDLDSGGLHVRVGGATAARNDILDSAGSGIVLEELANNISLVDNLIVGSGTNGILVDMGISLSYECLSYYYWGAPYYYEFCDDYGYVSSPAPLTGVVIYENTISGSGTEGIENHGANTVISSNLVTGSGIYDFTNNGTINVPASTGNSPDTGDWSLVPEAVQLK